MVEKPDCEFDRGDRVRNTVSDEEYQIKDILIPVHGEKPVYRMQSLEEKGPTQLFLRVTQVDPNCVKI